MGTLRGLIIVKIL